jgi:sialate O-acetylesterase
MSRIQYTLFFILINIIIPVVGIADIRLPSIVGDHMVLQQKSEVTLWGWCNPSEKIRIMVDWDTTIYTVKGTSGAKWQAKIKTPAAGGPYQIIINGDNVVVLDDVMIGEVWVCSGQSNMEWSGSQNLKQSMDEAPKATNQKIRFFYVPKTTAEYPQEDCRGKWVVCNPADMSKFSAIGYFFGKKLQEDLNYPIGLINSNWGGTAAETWTPKEVIEADPLLMESAKQLNDSYGYWPAKVACIYNAMIYPLTHYAIAGVLWYQGESNVGINATYRQTFTSMIDRWRKAWRKEFPFYFVQIAPFSGYGNTNINGALLREAQTQSAAFPNTAMVVIHDLVDDVKDIHPANKLDVALRLANVALAETYGKKGIPYKNPLYKSMTTEGDKIRLSFDNAENGLIVKGGDLKDFKIAGEDKKFQTAVAKIEGNTVIVFNKDIKKPAAVRFGFENAAMPNLFNKEGLPVNLFRTDNWDNVDMENTK